MHPESGQVASEQVEVQRSDVVIGDGQNCPISHACISALSLDGNLHQRQWAASRGPTKFSRGRIPVMWSSLPAPAKPIRSGGTAMHTSCPSAQQLAADSDAGLDIAAGSIECQHKFHRVILAFHFPCVFCLIKAAAPRPARLGQTRKFVKLVRYFTTKGLLCLAWSNPHPNALTSLGA